MKKNDNPNSLRRFKLWRKLLIVKLLCVCLFLQNTALSASVYSQELKLTLKGNDISLTNIFSQIRESSDYTFVYNLDDIQNVRVKSLDVKDASIREVLDKCLKGTGFSYEIEDHVVIIRPDRPAKQEVKKVTLKGIVMDKDSVPIAGVTVLLKGTYVGVTTDIAGKFQMAIPEQNEVFLLFSFVGMETQEVKVIDFKKLIRENFAVEKNYGVTDVEYELVDEPYLGYQIHLNKLSCGWRPLFQRHKNIKSFKQLEGFCMKNNNIVEIYDEYGEKYTWKQYYDKVYNHSQCKPKPFKWVYEIDLLFKDNKPTLHVVPCTESEAEIYMPFCHKEYREKERRARECFHAYERPWYGIKYWEDPDFPFDWMEGEFC